MQETADMKVKISEITQKYLEGKTQEAFAQELGIPAASRQMVNHWKVGKQTPALQTIFWVISSPTATATAKAWAGECLNVILEQQVEARLAGVTKPLPPLPS